MKLISSVVMSVAVLAGLAGSAVAYQVASADPGSPTPQQAAVVTESPSDTATAAAEERWAPCEPPRTSRTATA